MGVPTQPAPLAGSRYVIAIGIDAYEQMPLLRNAVADARAGMALFERLGFAAVRPPLVDGEATRDALWRLVTDDLAALREHDSLVVLFAGHGGTRTQELHRKTIKTGFLLPVDATPEVYSSWVNLDFWIDQLSKLPPRHILVVIDACHSGLALGSLIKDRDMAGSSARQRLDALSRRLSRRIITSALEDEVARDSGPVAGHSLFMGCLLEGLEGKLARPDREAVTGSELGAYLQRRVRELSEKQQTPDFGAFHRDERGELVIPVLRPEGEDEDEDEERQTVEAEKTVRDEATQRDASETGDPQRDDATLPETVEEALDRMSTLSEPVERGAGVSTIPDPGELLDKPPPVRMRSFVAAVAVAAGLAALPLLFDSSSYVPVGDGGAGLVDAPPRGGGEVRDAAMPMTEAELVRRVVARDAAAVRRLVAAGVDVNAAGDMTLEPCWYGRGTITVLTRAVLDGDVEIAKQLLAAGAAVSAIAYERHDDGVRPAAVSAHRTPLLAAARCSAGSNETLVELLLAHRADAKALTATGETVLFRCRARGAIAALVSAGAALEQVSEPGMTALMTAVQDGDGPLASALLAAGADPNHASRRETPLGLAAEHHPGLMESLLSAGARLERDPSPLLLRTLGDGSAARLAAARELIARGAKANGRVQGKPLLDHLLAREDLGGARALVQLGADVEGVLRAASTALAAGRYAEAARQCSVVADAIESTEAAWICAQARCGLGELEKARGYAARSTQDRRDRFENLCANMLP